MSVIIPELKKKGSPRIQKSPLTYTHTHKYKHTHIYTFLFTHTHTHTHTHTQTHTLTHIYIYIYITKLHLFLKYDCYSDKVPHHHHHVALVARISLTLSRPSSLSFTPQAGLQDNIPYPHIAAECMFVLVVLLLHGHVWGSRRVHLL